MPPLVGPIMRWSSAKSMNRAGQVAKFPASDVNTASGAARSCSSRITAPRFRAPAYCGTTCAAARTPRSSRVHPAQAPATRGNAAAARAKAFSSEVMPSAGRNTRPISDGSG